MITRRDFLKLSTLLACGTTVPTFLARSASALAAQGKQDAKGRVLLVVQLDGGNDGLNTVVPYEDDIYRKSRPELHLAANRLHKIDDHIGLHTSLEGFSKLLQNQELAIVQSVGYPNPNRSHFEAMAVWHSAQLQPGRESPGWLARGLNHRLRNAGQDVPALSISEGDVPRALAGSRQHVPSLASLEQFRRRLGVPDSVGAQAQRLALDEISRQEDGAPGSLLQFIQRSTVISYASSARLEEVMRGRAAPTGYPESYPLAQRLKLISQLLKAGLSTSIYYTRLGGFDTHANQEQTHSSLLRQLADSLRAFLNDMNKSGEGKRILVLVFSEFGRRLAENASSGTDHGTAAPVFLLGRGVTAGKHGPYPNLKDLDDGGDPKHAVDFRQVYATLLDEWLGCPSEVVLGEKFAHVPLIVRGTS
ncbi:MAG TPA: DUF1501 domain-containing protein [Gemmataceae bacterium]|nr:DUF1501 domain-containing protein [Gemmataceae bacterium]